VALVGRFERRCRGGILAHCAWREEFWCQGGNREASSSMDGGIRITLVVK
jgi:hypothetical protein